MKLTPEALRHLEEFHRTPVASVLRPNRPPQWEPWEVVVARYRAAAGALEAEDCGCSGRACMACRALSKRRHGLRRTGGAR